MESREDMIARRAKTRQLQINREKRIEKHYPSGRARTLTEVAKAQGMTRCEVEKYEESAMNKLLVLWGGEV